MAKKKQKKRPEEQFKRAGPVPFEIRVRIVQAVMRGAEQADVAVAFGVSVAAVQKYVALFGKGGIEALRPKVTGAAVPGGKKKQKPSRAHVPVAEIVETREANPEWGTRRIRDVLARFAGLGVTESTVRRILHEEGLIPEQARVEARDKPVRRFERAEPNQMWQSDIFTFELRRHQRVYLVGFMDDCSRYLVSWAMAHHQKSSLVIEALERGIAEYGEPREVLTDQGRQYAAWRGETEFQELLRRYGIAHSTSRPQHPETLGKIERFWKTLWEEFLRKTVFADFADCLRRVALFVQHYNFQRPHQGIDGLVPADRFFRAAPHVRSAIEAQVQANALRLAQEKPPQKPFYLVGRLGDQDLSIAAAGGALRVQVGDASQTIPMTKEHDDETKASRTFLDDEAPEAPWPPARGDRSGPDAARGAGASAADVAAVADAGSAPPTQAAAPLKEADPDEAQANDLDDLDEAGPAAHAAPAWHPALADRAQGPRSGRAAADAADLVRALGPHAGDDGDRRAWDLAAALLPARDQGPDRDDAGAGARRERGVESGRRDADAAAGGARGQGRASRAGEPPTGAPPPAREEGATAGTTGVPATPGPEAPQIDDVWTRTFAELAATDDDPVDRDLDPDDGWRDRVLTWNRKLAGADAPHEGESDGETTASERTIELPRPAGDPARAAPPVRRDPGGARRAHDDQRGGAGPLDRAGQHAEPGTPCRDGDGRGTPAEADRAEPQAGDGARARGASASPRAGEREAPAAAAGGGRHDGRGGRDHPQPAWPRPLAHEDFLAALEAIVEREQSTGDGIGSRTGTNGGDPEPSPHAPDGDD